MTVETAPEPQPAAPRRRRPRRVHGPQYQMVTKQLRDQFGTNKTRTPEQAAAFARVAGLVQSARSIACRIDQADSPDPCPNAGLSTHDCRVHSTSARDYTGLHEQLARTLDRLKAPEPPASARLEILMQALTPGVPPTTPPLPGIVP